MPHTPNAAARIPAAPKSIQKGTPLKHLLGREAVDCLLHNIALSYADFDQDGFRSAALEGLEPLGILERGQKIGAALRQHLPQKYATAAEILLGSLTPPLTRTDSIGLEVFFYLPHVCFVREYGVKPEENEGEDPFEISMQAQYELTQRFSAEFSIRSFLISNQERTMTRLSEWTSDGSPHVRRLCSEGTRPRLPWSQKIPAFVRNPAHTLPILEALKHDPDLYVRRSVANHLGDVAKDHPDFVFSVCERWLAGASNEIRWLIRHALRHPAKKGNATALRLRAAAKPLPGG